MAQQDIPEVYSSVPGSGGSGWEQETSPSLHYDPVTGRLIMGYLNADGSVTPAPFKSEVVRTPGGGGGVPLPIGNPAPAAATPVAAEAAPALSQYGPYASSYAFPPAVAAPASIAAPASSPSIWSRIFGATKADKILTAAGIGGNLVGNIIQSRQASKAAEAQEKAAAEALALQSNIYQQQRADLAPYRNAGSASLASLSYGLGLNPSAQADTTTPYFQQQAQQQNAAVPGQAQPRNPTSLASLSGPVQLRAPNGQVKAVDPSQVQHYISMGARPV